MRKSPSRQILPDIINSCGILLPLIGESRINFGDIFDKNEGNFIDKFEKLSDEYEKNPNLDNLFRLAIAVFPISESTAVIYCKMVLEQYPFHEGAMAILENSKAF